MQGRSVDWQVMGPSAVHELLVRLAGNLESLIWSAPSGASVQGPLSSSMPLVMNRALLHERLLPAGVEGLLARMDVHDRQLVQHLAFIMEHVSTVHRFLSRPMRRLVHLPVPPLTMLPV